MNDDLYIAIRQLIKDIRKQLGKDNEVAKFVSAAIVEKLSREHLITIIEEEDIVEK